MSTINNIVYKTQHLLYLPVDIFSIISSAGTAQLLFVEVNCNVSLTFYEEKGGSNSRGDHSESVIKI